MPQSLDEDCEHHGLNESPKKLRRTRFIGPAVRGQTLLDCFPNQVPPLLAIVERANSTADFQSVENLSCEK